MDEWTYPTVLWGCNYLSVPISWCWILGRTGPRKLYQHWLLNYRLIVPLLSLSHRKFAQLAQDTWCRYNLILHDACVCPGWINIYAFSIVSIVLKHELQQCDGRNINNTTASWVLFALYLNGANYYVPLFMTLILFMHLFALRLYACSLLYRPTK